MIIQNTQRSLESVRAINSRLPIHSAIYGDGLSDIIQGLFRRRETRALSTQTASGPTTNVQPQPVKLPSTEVMPARESKIINQTANERLKELAGGSSLTAAEM